MNIEIFALRIGLALAAGLLIGAEREYKGKSAGLKTNMLVALGSAVFILISLKFEGEKYVDITRVLSQVVIGIGFIGAGSILKDDDKNLIKGLTTAATVWCSAGAGCLAGFGMYWELIVLTLVIVISNLVFGYFDSKIKKDKHKDSVD
ncbi:MAG: MgtC/SapB family protein [Flavobacteriaceae bacterium]|nr:MgtC/SapB family protein [Flavobacteriaceae bacterium]